LHANIKRYIFIVLLQFEIILFTLTHSNKTFPISKHPTAMKIPLVMAALPDSHSLKIAHPEPVKTENVLTMVNTNLQQKNSPYFKKFFQVTPAVQQQANWDDDWFNSYE